MASWQWEADVVEAANWPEPVDIDMQILEQRYGRSRKWGPAMEGLRAVAAGLENPYPYSARHLAVRDGVAANVLYRELLR